VPHASQRTRADCRALRQADPSRGEMSASGWFEGATCSPLTPAGHGGAGTSACVGARSMMARYRPTDRENPHYSHAAGFYARRRVRSCSTAFDSRLAGETGAPGQIAYCRSDIDGFHVRSHRVFVSRGRTRTRNDSVSKPANNREIAMSIRNCRSSPPRVGDPDLRCPARERQMADSRSRLGAGATPFAARRTFLRLST